MKQLEYWNRVGKTKEFTTEFRLDAFSSVVNKESYILDVGCGYGRVLAELWNSGYRCLYGVDIAETLIQRGKTAYPHLDLEVQKKCGSLAFEDSSFDAVLLCAVLTCIPDESAQKRLIAEIHRILKPGGILYCNDFLLNTDERNLERYRLFEPEFKTYGVFRLPEGAVLRHHSEEYVHSLFCGFSEKIYHTVEYRTMNGHSSRGFYYLGANSECEVANTKIKKRIR